MFLGTCPAKGRLLMGDESVVTLFNLEPGVIVMRWECPCGETHLTAHGRIAESRPDRAVAAVRAVRAHLDAA